MRPGSLVIKSSRWNSDSRHIGVVLHASSSQPDSWLVLWTTKESYKVKIHLSHALIELDDTNDKVLLQRTCTST